MVKFDEVAVKRCSVLTMLYLEDRIEIVDLDQYEKTMHARFDIWKGQSRIRKRQHDIQHQQYITTHAIRVHLHFTVPVNGCISILSITILRVLSIIFSE